MIVAAQVKAAALGARVFSAFEREPTPAAGDTSEFGASACVTALPASAEDSADTDAIFQDTNTSATADDGEDSAPKRLCIGDTPPPPGPASATDV